MADSKEDLTSRIWRIAKEIRQGRMGSSQLGDVAADLAKEKDIDQVLMLLLLEIHSTNRRLLALACPNQAKQLLRDISHYG